jgi:hypothetical protein
MAKMRGERLPANYDGWDFSPGRIFELEVVCRFGSWVHHPSSSLVGSFFLLAVFHHSSFRLTEESVGLALHSVLGSSPSGFHIGCIKPCHFRFSVASKEVGFLISTPKRITIEHFVVYFSSMEGWWSQLEVGVLEVGGGRERLDSSLEKEEVQIRKIYSLCFASLARISSLQALSCVGFACS